ncbi:Gfo/Idh/MocA family protein [Paenibacillus senegalensis]|uniref:Gfo/Idh/MocA family protein n=1 Tax=Paenibacillus senegalensis TaxID=1465766 RepID=UPI000287C599|nr:Gfo/Idh/MocA family oxidoreductase [Paenibacillus senegalensis]
MNLSRGTDSRSESVAKTTVIDHQTKDHAANGKRVDDMETGSHQQKKLPVTAVIVGCGHRSLIYASYALQQPDELKIVGIVDPLEERRKAAAAKFSVSEDQCYASVDDLVKGPRIADAVINGTMDALHVETTIPLLRAGYDVLLEKPIGISEEEVLSLYEEAKRLGRKVMICHVLRYAPFYAAVRQKVADGVIGDLLQVLTTENVSYHHMATAFVRGKWRSKEQCGSHFLMAKSCHDLDLITWMKTGVRPVKVSSFGYRSYFREDQAPAGSGKRCLVDCEIERECPYSAKRLYVEQQMWGDYIWEYSRVSRDADDEAKLEDLRTENPYGRCVWRCDNDVTDHQNVIIEFEDESTATHVLTGGTAKPCRSIHLIGTKGEIEGVMEDGYFVIRKPNLDNAREPLEERIELNVSNDMHGGGDLRLAADFVNMLKGGEPSISATSLESSIYGHLIGFHADQARLENSVYELQQLED